MADLSELVARLKKKVSDEVFPFEDTYYESEIQSALDYFGYSIDNLPKQLEPMVLLKAQTNMYYDLAGKHARYHRVRIEGDIEIHRQHTAENYLKMAMALEDRLDKEIDRFIGSVEMIEATRWRVSDNILVPKSDGSGY